MDCLEIGTQFNPASAAKIRRITALHYGTAYVIYLYRGKSKWNLSLWNNMMTSFLLATTNSELYEPLSTAANLLNEAHLIQGHVSVQYRVLLLYSSTTCWYECIDIGFCCKRGLWQESRTFFLSGRVEPAPKYEIQSWAIHKPIY